MKFNKLFPYFYVNCIQISIEKNMHNSSRNLTNQNRRQSVCNHDFQNTTVTHIKNYQIHYALILVRHLSRLSTEENHSSWNVMSSTSLNIM